MITRVKKLFTLKRILVIFALIIITAVIIVNHQFRLYDRLKFNLNEKQYAKQWKDKSIWLTDYKVTIEAKKIKGYDNLSGLTWSDDSKTLYTITNKNPHILELSSSGDILRVIKVEGLSDPEALTYIGNNHFIITEERNQRLVKAVITPETTEIDLTNQQRMTLGEGNTDNKGLEGLTWNSKTQTLYAAKERDPVIIYEITGFPITTETTPNIIVTNNKKRDRRLFIKDLSSLSFNEQYNHLLVLSDESRLVIELNEEGKPISSLSLIRGHGLTKSIAQAEGIAMDDHNNLYIISEPNLFFKFEKLSSSSPND